MPEPRPQPPSPREPDAASEAVLVGLVSHMDDGQRLRLKVALVEQAIEIVLRSVRAGDDGDGGVYAARQWLAEPTEDRAKSAAAFAGADAMDGGARYFDYPDFFLAPADAAGSSDVVHCARVVRRTAAKAAESGRLTADGCAPGEHVGDPAVVERAALEFQITAARECLAGPGRQPEPGRVLSGGDS